MTKRCKEIILLITVCFLAISLIVIHSTPKKGQVRLKINRNGYHFIVIDDGLSTGVIQINKESYDTISVGETYEFRR